MIIEVVQIIPLALAPIKRWEYTNILCNSAAVVWSMAFVTIAVIIPVTLVLWIIARRNTHRLKQKIAELKAANKMLQQEVDELRREQVDILEDIIDAEPPPTKKMAGFNPQELKALSELARRLS